MKQPRALKPLFLTEMWERFGFYVTQSLLVLYLTQSLNFSDSNAFVLLGEFTALVYIAPLVGGFFADRILGPRYAILLGAVLLGLGYLLLGIYGHHLLFLSLSIVVTGNGLLKPNISSFLGEFYYPDDPRRDAGFTLFYIGINIGALLAVGSAGFIQEKLGWEAAFIAAGLGMVLALGTFWLGFRTYENRGMPVLRSEITPHSLAWMSYKPVMFLLLLIFIGIVYLLISSSGIASILQSILGAAILITLIVMACRYEKVQRHKFLALIILILASVVFWGIFFQMFGAVTLFTERNVNRHIFNWFVLPAPAFIALESIFIIILGPFLAALWQRLHEKHRDLTAGMKFTLAMFSVAVAMAILMFAIHLHPDSSMAAGWIIIFYVFITLGEMLLSPIGLSMVTELSPPHLSGLMMGVWFMALGFGGQLSGYLAKQASIPKKMLGLSLSNKIYFHAFTINTLLALGVGIILLLLTPLLKRLVKN